MPPAQSSASLPSISEDMSSSSAVTSSSPETHSCPYANCNKSFSKKYNLKAHLRLHTGEQPFECDRPDCRKKFKWRSSLSSHSVWHSRKDNAASSATTPTKPSPSSKSNSQKTSASRTVRVAPHANRQLSNSQNSSSSASVSSPSSRKKRPRSEMSGCSAATAQSTRQESSANSSTSRVRSKSKGSVAKKQRRMKNSGLDTTSTSTAAVVKTEETATKDVEIYDTNLLDDGSFGVVPGSPVTSDGSISEPALDPDEFSCDILEPLLSRGDTLELENDSDILFGYEEAGCGGLSGFDSRFEQLDLENFGNLYLNRLENL